MFLPGASSMAPSSRSTMTDPDGPEADQPGWTGALPQAVLDGVLGARAELAAAPIA